MIELHRRHLLSAAIASGAPGSQSTLPVFDALAHGAVPDGRTLSTGPIQKAIDAAEARGGGLVYVPPGDFLTGTLQLKSRVTLYLEAGATLWGSQDRAQYRHEALLYAEDAVDAALCGRGAIDGNGRAFWRRSGNRWLAAAWRPMHMLAFLRCENLLIEGVTLRNTPCWALHPMDCDRLAIRGISILNGVTEDERGPNQDGIDPDACTRVRISDCYIQSGDDSIVLKIMDRPGGRRVCSDIAVSNCVIQTRESALKIGSETCGEFRNISFSNCAIRDAGCGVGLWMRDGGLIDGFTVDNISMTLSDGGTAVYMTSYPRSRLPEKGEAPPRDSAPGIVRNVSISNVVATADGCVFLCGQRERPFEQFSLTNLRLHLRGAVKKPLHAEPPYPFPVWGHRDAPYSIYCRFARDLALRNIHLTWDSPERAEWGSAIRLRDCADVEVAGFQGRQAKGSDTPAIHVRDTAHVFVHSSRPARETGTFLGLEGAASGVTAMNNDLSSAERLVSRAPGVPVDALFESGNRPPQERKS